MNEAAQLALCMRVLPLPSPTPAQTATSNHMLTPDTRAAIKRINEWLQWLTATSLASLYPGAPHERRFLALQLLNNVLDVWQEQPPAASAAVQSPLGAPTPSPQQQQQQGPRVAEKAHLQQQQLLLPALQPFCPGFFSGGTVTTLLGTIVDSWDRLREGSVQALLALPSPLPGLDQPEQLSGLVRHP